MSALLALIVKILRLLVAQKVQEAVQTEERVHEAADAIHDRDSAIDSLRERKR